jgi:hypothetical protein
MYTTRIERRLQVKTAINNIIAASNGTWVSVKDPDKSLSGICKTAGLDTNWTAATVKCLREQTNFGMVDGIASGMRYKFPTDLFGDVDKLIPIVEQNHEDQRSTKSTETQAFVTKVEKIKPEKLTKISRRTHFNIDDIVFCLNLKTGLICEVEICGVFKDDECNYRHDLNFGNKEFENNVLNSKLFESVEQLTTCLSKRVQKFQK